MRWLPPGGNILTGGKLLVDALNRKLEYSESNLISNEIEFKDFSFLLYTDYVKNFTYIGGKFALELWLNYNAPRFFQSN